jgi:hypothetical protein
MLFTELMNSFILNLYTVLLHFMSRYSAWRPAALRRSGFWDMTLCSPMSAEVSEQHIASLFKIEEEAKKRTGMTQAVSRAPFVA